TSFSAASRLRLSFWRSSSRLNEPPLVVKCFTIPSAGVGSSTHVGRLISDMRCMRQPSSFMNALQSFMNAFPLSDSSSLPLMSGASFFVNTVDSPSASALLENSQSLRSTWKTLLSNPETTLWNRGDVSSIPASSRHMFSKRMYAVYVPYIMYMWISHMRRQVLMVSSKFWRSSELV